MFTDKPDMEFVEFDWAERCLFETPLQYVADTRYGGVSGSPNFMTFTANSKNNTAILHSNWGEGVYVDNGLNNVVKCMGMPSKALINAITQWPVKQQSTDFNFHAGAALQRREGNTFGDMNVDVWKPQSGEFPAEALLTSTNCVLWLDASDLSTLWQDINGDTTQADADGDPVRYWADKSGSGNDFDARSGHKTGFTLQIDTPASGQTRIDTKDSYQTPLKADGDVIISGATGTDGDFINGPHTGAVRLTNERFYITLDISGKTIDASTMVVQPADNSPELETDVDGKGVHGVLFNGTTDMMEQVAKQTGIDLDEVNDVGCMVCVITPLSSGADNVEGCIGRGSATGEYLGNYGMNGTTVRRGEVKWGNDGVDYIYNISAIGANTQVLIGNRIDNGATYTDEIYMGMSDFKIERTGQTGTFAGTDHPWQLGTQGFDNSEANLFDGYLHAVALFDRTLTEAECREIMFYFSNKFVANPVEAYDI